MLTQLYKNPNRYEHCKWEIWVRRPQFHYDVDLQLRNETLKLFKPNEKFNNMSFGRNTLLLRFAYKIHIVLIDRAIFLQITSWVYLTKASSAHFCLNITMRWRKIIQGKRIASHKDYKLDYLRYIYYRSFNVVCQRNFYDLAFQVKQLPSYQLESYTKCMVLSSRKRVYRPW